MASKLKLIEGNNSSIGTQLKANQELNNKLTYILEDFKSSQSEVNQNQLDTLKKENDSLRRLFESKPINLSLLNIKNPQRNSMDPPSNKKENSNSFNTKAINESEKKKSAKAREARAYSTKKSESVKRIEFPNTSKNSDIRARDAPCENNREMLKRSIDEAKIKMANLLKGKQSLEQKLHSIKKQIGF